MDTPKPGPIKIPAKNDTNLKYYDWLFNIFLQLFLIGSAALNMRQKASNYVHGYFQKWAVMGGRLVRGKVDDDLVQVEITGTEM